MTEQSDITLHVEKGITPTQLVGMLAEQGIKPLFQHASAQHFGVRSSAAKFEDGIDQDLLKILEEYYTIFLSDTELAQNFSRIRVKLLDWISQYGVEAAEVNIQHIGQDRETSIHPQDEYTERDPSITVFLPPKYPGPNVALHNPFGTGKTEFTTTRETGGEILSKKTPPPRKALIVQDSGKRLQGNEQRIQLPGETLVLNAPMHASRLSTGAHQRPIHDFDTLERSGMEYHQLTGVRNWTASPTGIFVRGIK